MSFIEYEVHTCIYTSSRFFSCFTPVTSICSSLPLYAWILNPADMESSIKCFFKNTFSYLLFENLHIIYTCCYSFLHLLSSSCSCLLSFFISAISTFLSLCRFFVLLWKEENYNLVSHILIFKMLKHNSTYLKWR